MEKLSPKEARDIIMLMFQTLFLGGLTAEEAADALEEVIEEISMTEPCSCELHQTPKRKRQRKG